MIDSVMNGFPLNVMYWVVREDGGYEVMDGQQRTVSIGQFVHGDFSYNMRYFHNLEPEERARFLGYQLKVYFCSGTDEEKIRWFERINIAGKDLSRQEIRNAVYHGPWVVDAKRWFSKRNAPARKIARNTDAAASPRRRGGGQEGHHPLPANGRGEASPPARIFRRAAAQDVRAAGRGLPALREAVRAGGDARRPCAAMVPGRADDAGERADALPRLQLDEGQAVGRHVGDLV